ncbi:hypothetical protein P8935_00690 [Telmatobacter sp. DSM 110680]|uniref:DUF2846 domain-containing protein n=1 Tax=Telmatobacter sp. DSM 110680 TaxID=3036704 RepID=A0AAU7DKL4_9BACT
MIKKDCLAIALVLASFMWSASLSARPQQKTVPEEVGIVYYSDSGIFKPLDKESAAEGGRSNYAARVNRAHATVRLPSGQLGLFSVCGVDPTRFKLYKFKSEGNSRTLTIARNNMLIGGSKVVISKSEIPLSIKREESGCFTLTPRKALDDGEFGFSPLESMDAFMFGVGDIK